MTASLSNPPDRPLEVCVIVCTYNRCQSLRRTLESISELDLPSDLAWEVLVVNNNCTDDTDRLALDFAGRLPVRVTHETSQGLSHARNRGFRATAAEWVVFTDDDVLLDRAWLRSLVEAARRHAEADYLGGRLVPYWPHGQPRWFREETLKSFGGLIANYDLDCPSRWYTDQDLHPVGANMAYRRELLEKLGGFRVDIGMIGDERGSGEETELIERARRFGARGYFVAEAVCRHYMRDHYSTLRHAFFYGYDRGKAQVLMNDADPPAGSRFRAVCNLVRGAIQGLRGRGDQMRLCIRNAGIELGRIGEIANRRRLDTGSDRASAASIRREQKSWEARHREKHL